MSKINKNNKQKVQPLLKIDYVDANTVVTTKSGHMVMKVNRFGETIPSKNKLVRRKRSLHKSKPTKDDLIRENAILEANNMFTEAELKTQFYLTDERLSEKWARTTDSASIFISSFGDKVLNMNYKGKTYNRFKPKLMKIDENNTDGYMRLYFKDINGKLKRPYMHRAVYTAFKGDIPNNMQVNHLSGIKSNNHVDNLELNTASENLAHARETGLNKNKRLSVEQRESIIELYLSNKELSYRQIGEHLNITTRNVSNTIQRYKKRTDKS